MIVRVELQLVELEHIAPRSLARPWTRWAHDDVRRHRPAQRHNVAVVVLVRPHRVHALDDGV